MREIRATALTHRGAVRASNEDAIVMGAVVSNCDMSAPAQVSLAVGDSAILAVADGVGGHRAGEIASEHVARRLAEVGADLQDADALAKFLPQLDEELSEHALRYEEFDGMGTTVAGVLVTPTRCHWFNVGDSRVYRIDGPHLTQITEDDAPPSPAPTSFITQSLGGNSKRGITPHVGDETGAAWLLCSDGLTDLVSLDHMAALLSASASDEGAVHALWSAAMEAGGKDNISVLIARLH